MSDLISKLASKFKFRRSPEPWDSDKIILIPERTPRLHTELPLSKSKLVMPEENPMISPGLADIKGTIPIPGGNTSMHTELSDSDKTILIPGRTPRTHRELSESKSKLVIPEETPMVSFGLSDTKGTIPMHGRNTSMCNNISNSEETILIPETIRTKVIKTPNMVSSRSLLGDHLMFHYFEARNSDFTEKNTIVVNKMDSECYSQSLCSKPDYLSPLSDYCDTVEKLEFRGYVSGDKPIFDAIQELKRVKEVEIYIGEQQLRFHNRTRSVKYCICEYVESFNLYVDMKAYTEYKSQKQKIDALNAMNRMVETILQHSLTCFPNLKHLNVQLPATTCNYTLVLHVMSSRSHLTWNGTLKLQKQKEDAFVTFAIITFSSDAKFPFTDEIPFPSWDLNSFIISATSKPAGNPTNEKLLKVPVTTKKSLSMVSFGTPANEFVTGAKRLNSSTLSSSEKLTKISSYPSFREDKCDPKMRLGKTSNQLDTLRL